MTEMIIKIDKYGRLYTIDENGEYRYILIDDDGYLTLSVAVARVDE